MQETTVAAHLKSVRAKTAEKKKHPQALKE